MHRSRSLNFRLDAADADRLVELAAVNRNSIAAELRRAVAGHLGLLDDERPRAGRSRATSSPPVREAERALPG